MGFLGRFVFFVLLSYGILAIPAIDRLLYGILELTAGSVAPMLSILGYRCTVEGVTIHGDDFSVAVRRGCDGVEPMLILWSAVVAMRAPLVPTVAGLAISAVIIQIVNFVRVVSLFVIGSRCPAMFHVMHVEIWPVIMIAVEMVIFMLWLNLIRTRRKDS